MELSKTNIPIAPIPWNVFQCPIVQFPYLNSYLKFRKEKYGEEEIKKPCSWLYWKKRRWQLGHDCKVQNMLSHYDAILMGFLLLFFCP